MHRYGHLGIYLGFTLLNSLFGEIPIPSFRSWGRFLRIRPSAQAALMSLYRHPSTGNTPHNDTALSSWGDTHIPLASSQTLGWTGLLQVWRTLQNGVIKPSKLASSRDAMHILNICICKYFIRVSREIKPLPFPKPFLNNCTWNTYSVGWIQKGLDSLLKV